MCSVYTLYCSYMSVAMADKTCGIYMLSEQVTLTMFCYDFFNLCGCELDVQYMCLSAVHYIRLQAYRLKIEDSTTLT